MGQQLRPWAHEIHPTPPQIPGRPHVGGRDRGLREQTTTEQDRQLVGIAPVICGLAAVDRLPREGLSQDKGHACLGAEVGEPRPRQQACDSHDETISGGRHSLQARVWTGLHGAGHHPLAILLQETDVHGPGMQVDTAVNLMLWGGESHAVSSSPS
jgi:hypothetical protein